MEVSVWKVLFAPADIKRHRFVSRTLQRLTDKFDLLPSMNSEE